MNKTNFLHAGFALLIQFPFVFIGHPWCGAAVAIFGFIMREHAHRQVDIKITTGVPIAQQNPLMGFLGWSKDSKLDALFPCVTLIVAVIYG